MYKVIPGSKELRMDQKGNILNSFNEKVKLDIKDGKIDIELYGKMWNLDFEWLKLLTRYEYGHIENLPEHFDKIKFAPIDNGILRIPSGKLAYFTEPIYFIEGYRYVPGYPRTAMDNQGRLIDTLELKHYPTTEPEEKDADYAYVSTYCPLRNQRRRIALHRALCLAWLDNDDFSSRPYINHIDGDRGNYSLDNLEWCTHQENTRHALATGLNKSAYRVKCRDVRCGTVKEYFSFTDFCIDVGVSRGRAFEGLKDTLPGYLHSMYFEVKLQDDMSPWFYEGVDFSNFTSKKTFNIYTLTNKDTGKVSKYNSLKRIGELYSLPLNSKPIEVYIEQFLAKYPNYTFERERFDTRGPYYCLDLETNILHTADAIWKAAEITGVNRNAVRSDLVKKNKYIYDDKWIIFLDPDNLNKDEYIPKPKVSSPVTATNIETGEVTLYSGMKPASRALGTNFSTVKTNLNTDNPVKGHLIRTLDQ